MTGLVFLSVGIAFVFEALGAWTLSVGDLRLIGPLALVVAGLAVVIGSVTRRGDTGRS